MAEDEVHNSDMDPIEAKIGIIGESGLDTPLLLNDRDEYAICTPFGKPSDTVIEGSIENFKCCLLSRHGRLHNIMPSNVNYRANIWAMRKLGCTHILVTHSVSSLRENILPGSLVIPDDIIDNTRRPQTFYDGLRGSPIGVCHVPMVPPFCNRTREHLIAAAKEFDMPVHVKGTVLAMEGPRYSTMAENNMYRKWGADLLNMTICPEVTLAKEAGILCASLCLVTNKECWCANQPIATTTEIVYRFKHQVEKLQKVLMKAAMNIAKEDWSEDVLKAKIIVCSNFSNSNRSD